MAWGRVLFFASKSYAKNAFAKADTAAHECILPVATTLRSCNAIAFSLSISVAIAIEFRAAMLCMILETCEN